MKALLLGIAAVLACVAGGCTQDYAYSFKVSVHNDTAKPIIIWLTKDGPPAEEHWLSPEDLAKSGYDPRQEVGGRAVAPGGSAQSASLTGHFRSGTHAILRVYRGRLKMNEILAIDAGSPNRLDVMLQHEGVNRLVITDTDGKLGSAELPASK